MSKIKINQDEFVDEFINEVFNDIERNKVLKFIEDKIMFEAVKKYLLVYLAQGVAKPGEPLKGSVNYALQLAFGRQGEVYGNNGQIVAFTPRSDEEVGRDIKVLARGIQIIESGFKELSELKTQEQPTKDEVNPAV